MEFFLMICTAMISVKSKLSKEMNKWDRLKTKGSILPYLEGHSMCYCMDKVK